ncbi:hypothetical protein CPSG_05970 [Coccidioides posadasii str. Silveira]|uniref:Uncharacterized protein n=1 Tax=Coccidioides posadasii (strain RMSCC 757 / Silveira) TaxID=443226 RepID=E9D818_COCPS|nr:hypothetical protein CPSG_05970 [Coccidioides posadasii str. Silveira]
MLYCWKTTNAGPRECTWFTGPHVVKAEIIRIFEAIAVSAVIGFRIWHETNGFETLRSSIHPDLRLGRAVRLLSLRILTLNETMSNEKFTFDFGRTWNIGRGRNHIMLPLLSKVRLYASLPMPKEQTAFVFAHRKNCQRSFVVVLAALECLLRDLSMPRSLNVRPKRHGNILVTMRFALSMLFQIVASSNVTSW